MILPVPTTSHRRRVKAKLPTAVPPPPPPPPSANVILHVRRTVDGDTFAVELGADLVNALSAGGMLEVSIDGETWTPALNVIYGEDPRNIRFLFEEDQSAAMVWRVPVASDYVFAGGAPLSAPLSGAIEEA